MQRERDKMNKEVAEETQKKEEEMKDLRADRDQAKKELEEFK